MGIGAEIEVRQEAKGSRSKNRSPTSEDKSVSMKDLHSLKFQQRCLVIKKNSEGHINIPSSLSMPPMKEHKPTSKELGFFEFSERAHL
uniref:Uncharacterized protein n=1 Tax=Cucumis melo TaxID=3656 RepID=A0A9I9D8H5_CUCME